MINKIVPTAAAAVADIHDGATVMIGGFGTPGMPSQVIDALIDKDARNLRPVMAWAARCAIAEVREVVNLGDLDPEWVVTPGIYVQRVVEISAAVKVMDQPGAAA